MNTWALRGIQQQLCWFGGRMRQPLARLSDVLNFIDFFCNKRHVVDLHHFERNMVLTRFIVFVFYSKNCQPCFMVLPASEISDPHFCVAIGGWVIVFRTDKTLINNHTFFFFNIPPFDLMILPTLRVRDTNHLQVVVASIYIEISPFFDFVFRKFGPKK